MDASDAICSAIEGLRQLEFAYDGRPRLVEPYLFGFTRSGVATLRAVQVGGESRSGTFGQGKLWTASLMSGLRVSEERFVPDDPRYNPDDRAFARIVCRVRR
jgi:hypothetical protein